MFLLLQHTLWALHFIRSPARSMACFDISIIIQDFRPGVRKPLHNRPAKEMSLARARNVYESVAEASWTRRTSLAIRVSQEFANIQKVSCYLACIHRACQLMDTVDVLSLKNSI